MPNPYAQSAPWYNHEEADELRWEEDDEWNWAACQFAAKQHPKDAQWLSIVAHMHIDVTRFLAFYADL